MTIGALLACAAFGAHADGAASSAAAGASPTQAVEPVSQREQLAAQQAALKTMLAEREADCAHQFAVVHCVNSARSDQRELRVRLNAEELAHDAAQRGEDAERRRQSLAEKAAAFALRVKAADAVDANATPRALALAKPFVDSTVTATGAVAGTARVASERAEATSPKRSKQGAGESRAALEAQHVASFNARQRDAAAHRLAVYQRNVARAAEGTQMAPLPEASATRATELAMQR